MLPQTREDIKLYTLRKLGFPVIPIDVADEQVEDRIDEAVQLFQQFHYDGTLHINYAIQLSANNIANNTGGNQNGIVMPANTFSVTRLYTLASTSTTNMQNGFNMFDINYQIRLNELYDYTAGDYTYFVLANEHLRMLEIYFTGEQEIDYNRYTNTLQIHCDWNVRFAAGQFIMVECYMTPPTYATYWQDPWLLDYCTCLVKEQWGQNLKKFNSVVLPGGMILNGQQIYNEAAAEKEKLQHDLHYLYQEPAEWIVG